jgi:hypothetical protein
MSSRNPKNIDWSAADTATLLRLYHEEPPPPLSSIAAQLGRTVPACKMRLHKVRYGRGSSFQTQFQGTEIKSE